MEEGKSLNELKPGEFAKVKSLNCSGELSKRLPDIGLVEGTRIKCIAYSPLGDPKAFLIRGAVIAIRGEDCSQIMIYP